MVQEAARKVALMPASGPMHEQAADTRDEPEVSSTSS